MLSFCRCFGAAALVACCACLQGCNQQAAQAPPAADTRAADEAAIRAASAEWAKVAAAKDLDKTLSYYADDASMFPPNAPVLTGPEARRKAWTGLLAPAELVFSNAATKVEVARSGDLAYETGTFEESFKDDKGQPVKVVGKYVVVWKKQPTGQWTAIIDIFNTDQ
jgi:ketosteroid isomerase-like protein